MTGDPRSLKVSHSRVFSDASLEERYKEYLTKRYLPFSMAVLKYGRNISLFWLVLTLAGMILSSSNDTTSEGEKMGYITHAFSFGAIFIICLLARKIVKLKTTSIENIMFCTMLSIASCSLLGMSGSTNELSANVCFIEPLPDTIDGGGLEECAKTWFVTIAAQTATLNFFLIGGSSVGVLRRRKLKLYVIGINLIHMVRFLVITPILPDAVGEWVAVLNILIPLLYYYLGLKAEISKREMFLLQLRLKDDNVELATKLDAAESALAFEAPTSTEQSVVSHALQEQSEVGLLKDIEVPFKDLKLCERIASGAFGEVIKAEYAGDTVAVKRLLRSQINETSIRMLVQEVGLLRDLHHANIVTLIGVSWDSVANICIILEYMARGSLLGILEDSQLRLSWQDPKLKMLTDIASGLAYLHSRPSPVIHRDVKPDNVLVTPTFGCKLTDFGASRNTEIDSTMTQIGTQSYMAPEVIKGARYDEKVDVYSLGILIVVMHTRKKPFPPSCLPGQSVIAFVLCEGRPEVPPDMPGGLAELAAACWQEEARDRPASHRIVEMLMEQVATTDRNGGADCVGGQGTSPPSSSSSSGAITATTTTTSLDDFNGQDSGKETTAIMSSLAPALGMIDEVHSHREEHNRGGGGCGGGGGEGTTEFGVGRCDEDEGARVWRRSEGGGTG